jgi:hypothetical protein
MNAALVRLHALRGAFGAAAALEKVALLRTCGRLRWRLARDVRAYHDELLFIAAFPDTPALHRAACRALDRFARIVRTLPAPARDELVDTGIAGTATEHTFMYGIARWLARTGEDVRFAWARERDAERLDPLLRLTLTAAELDRFDSGEVGTRAWLEEASRDLPGGAVHWLLGTGPRGNDVLSDTVWSSDYDEAEAPLHWSLGDSTHSTSRNRVRTSRVRVRTGFRTVGADPVAMIRAPLPGIARLRGAEAARWHDASLAALAARTREVFPTIYANPDEIYRCPLGEGADLCVLGVAPDDRSVLEANYGYVIFSNGVPIGYGGVTTLGAQANTGANLFESFRRSEAAFLFAQSLRAFRTLFGVARFVVNPYQFGQGNEEAIASGAFWFYDRLGFRPATQAARALAARERTRIAADRTHRSSRRTLLALARADMLLELGGGATPLLAEHLLVTIGTRVTRTLSAIPAGAREAEMDAHGRRLLARCTGERRALRAAERLGARLLVPVLLAIEPAIGRWPAADRRALWRLVQLKGARQERGFARAAAAAPRFWQAVREAARVGR